MTEQIPVERATFSEGERFPNQINDPILDALAAIPLDGRKLRIVTPSTQPIIRGSGAAVLYNADDPAQRLAAWPDLRVQTYGNPDYIQGGLYKDGFNPEVPISSMTVMLTEDTPEEEPVLVRTVILESPEYLEKEKYVVQEDRDGKVVYVIRNAREALGLKEGTYAIIPGWSYIMPGKRAGEEGSEGITNIKDLAAISRTIVRTLNQELNDRDIEAVIISQQDGKILDEELVEREGNEIPALGALEIGTEIDPEEIDETGKKKWYIDVMRDGVETSISIFDHFGQGGKDSRATASFARRSKLETAPKVGHIIETGLGPVFTGDPATYGVEFNRKTPSDKIEG